MYGVCNTAAATAAKTVNITGFRLYTGARVTVKFTYASGAANSTLNVNGTGAKNMVRYGTTAIGNSSTLGWAAGAIQTFTYDGTSWVADYWQNTTYSNVALGHGYATCSTAAATAAKTASLSSYNLTKGGIVAVKFTYAVPANATLNINSKGAKNIYYRGAKIVAGIINAGDIAVFMYDGTQYQFLAKDYNNATTATAGLMSAADKVKLDGIATGATANTGDITGVTAGNGLTGGGSSGNVTLNVGEGTGIMITADTVSAKLRSTTALTIDSAAATTTTGRVYPVAVDKTGYLSVNVPWTDNNTDTKVTQTITTSNAAFPLLLAPNGQTATTTTTSYFDSGVTLNPSTNTIAANISGNAATATALATGRTLKVNLASTSASTAFTGAANVHDIGIAGTLPVGNGGTGQTNAANAANAFLNALGTGSSTPQDADYYISQFAGGGSTTTTYHRRPMSALWTYIQGKMSTDGNAATAGKLKNAFTLSLSTAAAGSVTIDGSQNRSLSVTNLKEAFLSWGGKAIKGSVSPLDAAMSSIHSANRFAFAKPAGIIIEYSNDAGATWNDYATTDAQKIRLVSGIGSSYKIGGPDKATGTHTVNDQVRISLIAKNMGVYTSLQKILLNINTNYATGCKVKVEHSTYGAQTTFVEDGNYGIMGWSGWNSIPIGASFGSTTSINWYMIRLTFSVTGVNSDTTKDSALTIVDITGHGPTYWGFPSSMAKTGHLYTYDENQAAIFAGSITVKNTSMYINGETAESVSNVGFQLQHNGNSIGKLFCSKAGTTSQGGTCQLVLGNAKGSTSNYNARGSIMMYSAATTGVTLLAHTIGTNYSYYFRDHDATIYSVGTSTRAAVGDESTPVYVNSNGFLTPCTSLSSGTDNEGNTISETYLKLTGGTVSGEVNSSINVATSSAAFRNIKVIAPGTEVVVGTTAIPTGEIWVRYEE